MQVSSTEKAVDSATSAAVSMESDALRLAYETKTGRMYQGLAEQLRSSRLLEDYRGKVQLILTSPPFPLNRKKRYGNRQGQEYVDWLAGFGPLFKELLTPRGSIVMEIGNAWEPGKPVMSPLALQALLKFLQSVPFNLCQQFVCYNPAKLPGPAQWVNVKRIRVKDAYTHVWWMSPSAYPRASNKRVLSPYTPSMLKLLKTKRYNAGKRPSEHNIGKKSFLTDNGGAIPSNVLEFANTSSSDDYLNYCRLHGLTQHPARMAVGLASWFIKFLTVPGNLVFDPFAGSNVTGAAAEQLERRWISIEPNRDYIESSKGRFKSLVEEKA